MTIRFGFEAEYDNNVPRLIDLLHNDGYAHSGEVHVYHCGCDYCDFDSGSIFRAQHDSSCGGEVISHPFLLDDDETWKDVLEVLSSAALAAQCWPTKRAGFHVHVSSNKPFRPVHRFAQFAILEQAYVQICTGPFSGLRHYNTRIQDIVLSDAYDGCTWNDIYNSSYIWDERHTTLNMNTQHDTWEFRMPNATRVPWRMELYILAAASIIDPDFVVPETESVGPYDVVMDIDKVWLDEFLRAAEKWNTRFYDLATKQIEYTNSNDCLVHDARF